MSLYDILTYAAIFGMVIGGIDLILNNRFGVGVYFKDALLLIGDFCVAALGLLVITPALAQAISPFASIVTKLGIDPAFIASVFAADVGGYTLAVNLAVDPEMGKFFGSIVCAMLGAGLIGLPIARGIISREDDPFFMRGMLIGIISVPFGSLAGGLIAGFRAGTVLVNSIPVFVISALLAFGLWKIPEKMIRGCMFFSRVLEIGAVVGLVVGAISQLLGVELLPGMMPIYDALGILFSMVIILIGMYPLLRLILRSLDKPLVRLADATHLRTASLFGILITSVNCFPAFKMYGEMDDRGKVLVSAWAVPMVATFGDLAAFTAAVEPGMLLPVISAKVISGVVCLAIARYFMADIPCDRET